MEEAKKNAALEEVRSTLLEMVATASRRIPQVMVEKKIDSNVEDFAYRLADTGAGSENLPAIHRSGRGKASRGLQREPLKKQVKLDLAIEKIIEAEKIEPNAEELEAEYKKVRRHI